MNEQSIDTRNIDRTTRWQKAVSNFQGGDTLRSMWQVANTFIPFFSLWVLMYFSLDVSYILTLLLAVPTAGFYVRMFIIFHDCGHGSFFKSKKANDWLGRFSGLITMTPYHFWTHDHAVHHATHGDLDRRGHGDVWTLTVQEYLELPKLKRLMYRFYRNPFVMFGLGPLWVFVIGNRLTMGKLWSRDFWSVMLTNISLIGVIAGLGMLIGFGKLTAVMLPIIWIGGSAGIFMFYVQHQFEDAYWENHEDWDFADAALKGSSFYKLPKVLQWFSGNIGYHHVHHLSPRIPNYSLEKCHDGEEMFQDAATITLIDSLKTVNYRIWDEDRKKLVGFKYIKTYLAKLEELENQKAQTSSA